MALHGDIWVNTEKIGVWEAVHQGSFPGQPRGDKSILVRCSVEMHKREQEPHDTLYHRDDFEVRHWPEDGPAFLASKVLWQYAVRKENR